MGNLQTKPDKPQVTPVSHSAVDQLWQLQTDELEHTSGMRLQTEITDTRSKNEDTNRKKTGDAKDENQA
jgi:hypothetical protein